MQRTNKRKRKKIISTVRKMKKVGRMNINIMMLKNVKRSNKLGKLKGRKTNKVIEMNERSDDVK